MPGWSGEGHLLGYTLLIVSSQGGKVSGAGGVFQEGTTLMTQAPPKAPPPDTITLDVRIPTWILWGPQTSGLYGTWFVA